MKTCLLAIFSFSLALPCYSESGHRRHTYPVGSHAGQMDTDGILSAGERRNPDINYYKAQRQAEHRADPRFNNPYNEWAAKRDGGDRYDYQERRTLDKNGTGFGNELHYGERSGELTGREVRDIRGMQDDLHQQERQFKSDGYLSDKERNELANERKKIQDNIEHNLNDGEHR